MLDVVEHFLCYSPQRSQNLKIRASSSHCLLVVDTGGGYVVRVLSRLHDTPLESSQSSLLAYQVNRTFSYRHVDSLSIWSALGST